MSKCGHCYEEFETDDIDHHISDCFMNPKNEPTFTKAEKEEAEKRAFEAGYWAAGLRSFVTTELTKEMYENSLQDYMKSKEGE